MVTTLKGKSSSFVLALRQQSQHASRANIRMPFGKTTVVWVSHWVQCLTRRADIAEDRLKDSLDFSA